MVEIYLAFIIICGFEGKCELFKDLKASSMTITECHKKLDDMWVRIRAKPKGVESTSVGKFSFIYNPRGFCLNSPLEESSRKIISKRYNL